MKKVLLLLVLLMQFTCNGQWNDPVGEKKVREVYERLYAATGYAEQSPELQFSKISMRMAYMSHEIGKRPTITIERKAFEVCETFGERSEDMIAVLLGHELMHHFFKHHWGTNFENTYFTEEFLKSETSSLRSEMKTFETQADESGLKLVYLAGYNPREIVSQFYRKLYLVYGMSSNDNLLKIASISDSLDAVGLTKPVLQDEVDGAIELANYAMLSKNNKVAIEAYEFAIKEGEKSKELYNNLGICYVQEYLKGVSKVEFPYILPMKRSDGKIIEQLDGWSDISESSLEKAIFNFREALKIDKDFNVAKMNLACILFIKRDEFGSQRILKDALTSEGSDDVFKKDLEVVLSLLDIYKTVKENKKQKAGIDRKIWSAVDYGPLDKFAKGGNEIAALNRDVLYSLSRFEELYSKNGIGKSEVSQYPSLNQRIDITVIQENNIELLVTLLDLANFAVLLGDNPIAIDLYQYTLSHGMHAKEIYNNLGLCYILDYLKGLDASEFPYFLPLELDVTKRLDSLGFSTKGGASLDLAIANFESALRFDREYAVAGINLACARILNNEFALADNLIREVQFYNQNDPYVLNNCELLLSIIGIESGGRNLTQLKGKDSKEKSKKKKKKSKKNSITTPVERITTLSESGHYLASLNINRLTAIANNSEIDELNLRQVPLNYSELSHSNYSYKDPYKCNVLEINKDEKYKINTSVQGGNVKIGNSNFTVRELETCIEFKTSRWLMRVIHNDFTGSTENGTKIGDSRSQVEETYGTPNSIVAASDGYFIVYNKCQIIFHINRLNKVQKWIIYQK